MKTGAVVVAAELYPNMTSFKPMLQLAGSTVIKTAISTLKSSGISPIVVVTGKHAKQLSNHLSKFNVTCIKNEKYADTDMYYSAKIGLNYIKDKTDRVFFLPADVPLFSRQSLFSMMGYMDCTDCDILTPLNKGKRGHPILIKNDIIPELLSYRGDEGLKGAINSFSGKKEVLELQDIGMTIDADKAEDFQLLKKYAKSSILNCPVTFSINISLSRKEEFFDDTVAELLNMISQNNSLSEACENLGISYSNGWKMLKIAENHMTFPLVESQAGGVGGGSSRLTEEAKEFLDAYQGFKEEMKRLGKENFNKYFSKYQKKEGLNEGSLPHPETIYAKR